jgi:hypothetical protein
VHLFEKLAHGDAAKQIEESATLSVHLSVKYSADRKPLKSQTAELTVAEPREFLLQPLFNKYSPG